MRRLVLVACGFALLLGVSPVAQQPAAVDPERPIFRLSVSLVQLDAVVTDKRGRHITTLGPGDFEVYQDGRPQPVTAVTYIQTDDGWVDTSGLPPLPADALKPQDARRVIAVVVDDLRMSFGSIYRARRGIDEFLARQFQPGDLGMIVTTSGHGISQLTYSPQILRAANSRLRFSLWNVQGASALAPIDGLADFNDGFGDFIERTFAESSILRIADAINAVKTLPGRKSVVLVSEGFTLFGPNMDNAYVRDLLQRLVDRANRAGVVVYALDPRGLVVTGLTAADNVRGGGSHISSLRSSALLDTQDALRFVAGETGGFAVVNSNDLGLGFRRIMADQSGYYLIGYQPEAGTLSAKSDMLFRRLKVKVKVKGLKVRTRAGFYGQATE